MIYTIALKLKYYAYYPCTTSIDKANHTIDVFTSNFNNSIIFLG